MQWSDIDGITQQEIDALDGAGVAEAAALAGVEDEQELAQRAGLPADRVAALCASARAQVEAALGRAGVNGPDALAEADPAALARQTGLAEAQLRAFRAAARKALGLPEDAPEPPPKPDAVLLAETSSKARVRYAGDLHEGIAIVAASEEEDGETLLARAQGDAVLLQERATLASVRLNGQSLMLPIYRVDAGVEERVRVAGLKQPLAAGGGGAAAASEEASGEPSGRSRPFSRLLGRKRKP